VYRIRQVPLYFYFFGLKIKIQNLSIGPILTTLYLENGKSYAKSVGILIQNFFKGIKKKIA
jgi:Kef-type K+ transport system membrane component KefB